MTSGENDKELYTIVLAQVLEISVKQNIYSIANLQKEINMNWRCVFSNTVEAGK